MPILFKDKTLDTESPFEAIAQYAIEKYYLIPYPGSEGIRFYHGGVHVSSTALNIDLLIQLYQKYCPDLLNNDGESLNALDIKLIKLAAIYHDSANTQETTKNIKEHADNFRRDMYAIGFSKKKLNLSQSQWRKKTAKLIKEKAPPKKLKRMWEEKIFFKSCYSQQIV